jgi:Ca2+-transporting ATPase
MSFAFLLMVHIPLVTTAAIIPLLGFPLLYLPVHIVWLELLIHPAAILSFQKPADGALATRRPTPAGFFAGFEWMTIVSTGVGVAAAVLAIFVLTVRGVEAPEHARSMALVTLVTSLAILLLTVSRGSTRAAWLVALCAIASTLAFTRVEALSALVHLHVLPAKDGLIAFIAGLIPALGGTFMHWRPGQETESPTSSDVRHPPGSGH